MGRNWIKVETVTMDKPEVCVMATQLRLDPDAVVGKLVRLWSWAEVSRINANAMSITFEFLDKLVGKKGFGAALLGYVAGQMIFSDPGVIAMLPPHPEWTAKLAGAVGALLVVGVGRWLEQRILAKQDVTIV